MRKRRRERAREPRISLNGDRGIVSQRRRCAEKIRFADEEYKRRRYARTDCSCDSTSSRGFAIEYKTRCERLDRVGGTGGAEGGNRGGKDR